MSFAMPLALLLLLPLGGLLALARSGAYGRNTRLPGRWQSVVAPYLRGYLAQRSDLARAGTPILCIATAALVIIALARPGLDGDRTDDYATLAGRVIVLDVGSDLARHRHFIDDLQRADPGVATAVIASSGDAYRIVPFTTAAAQINRYVRVLNAQMMPMPGHNPHLALAQAERILADAGFLVRQIVLVTARQAPDQIVGIPAAQSQRFLVSLAGAENWQSWASAQSAVVLRKEAVVRLTRSLKYETASVARSELPSARSEWTTLLLVLAAVLWLPLFRRRTP